MIDTHVHIMDPTRFPPPDGPGYKPRHGERATAEDLACVLSRHGIMHAVIVQLSGYGSDNRCILDAVANSDGRWRAIVSLPAETRADELDRLEACGTVGVRFNVLNLGAAAIADQGRLLAAIGERRWVAQVQCPAEGLPLFASVLEASTGPLVFDHLGLPDVGLGLEAPGFRWLLSFARRRPDSYIKLSGAFRVSLGKFPYSDLDPFVAAIIEAFPPDRRIWGSDWPFVATDAHPLYAQTLALIERWLPREDQQRLALFETPARLYRFEGTRV